MGQPFASIDAPLRARRNAGGIIKKGGVCVIDLTSTGFDAADSVLLVRAPDEDGTPLVFLNASGEDITDNTTVFYVRQADGVFSAKVDEANPQPGQIYGAVEGQDFMAHGGLAFVCVGKIAANLAILMKDTSAKTIKATAGESGGTITVKVIDDTETVQGNELTLVTF